jgi:hypothetical protein
MQFTNAFAISISGVNGLPQVIGCLYCPDEFFSIKTAGANFGSYP